ncbi:MAG: TetR/AcrR family transcriptional regulator C-terminal domain-containing protein [Steroidobacteraceae bacterium]
MASRKKQTITRERIAAAALDAANEVGLDGLSLRGVAARLKVTPMALYNHISDKRELEQFVVAHLLERTMRPLKVTARTSWQSILVGSARELRRALSRHPTVLQVYVRHPLNPDSMLIAEQINEAFARAGLAVEQRGFAFQLFTSYIVGAVLLEHEIGPMDEARLRDRILGKHASEIGRRFPRIQEIALATAHVKRPYFDHCVQLFISMLEAFTARPQRSPRSRMRSAR